MIVMKCTRTAAIILSLVMIFTFMPFRDDQKAYAMEVKGQVYLDVTGYQSQYAGPEAAAVYWFLKERMDTGSLQYLDYCNESHELSFHLVDLDNSGKYDLKVTPQFDGGEKVIGLTLEKEVKSNLNEEVGLALDSQICSKYRQMDDGSEYGLEYFYERIFIDLRSAFVTVRNNKTIYLYDGSQTFEGAEGQAVHESLNSIAGKGIIGKTSMTIWNGARETKYDLDNNGTYDIEESYRVDRSSNTITRLNSYSPEDELFVVSATNELAAEMAGKTILELQGLDLLYKSFIFNMVQPQQILPPPIMIKSLDGKKVSLSKSSFTYNGKVQKPVIKTIGGMELIEGTDYEIEWSNASSKLVGSYKIKIKGIGDYIGETEAAYKINKAANPLSVKAKNATVLAVKLRKKAVKLDASKVIRFVNKGKGSLKYAKKSGSKKILINRKNGKVTIKKGLKAGTYKVKVQVKAAGSANYKASSYKTVVFTIKVK